MRYFFHSLIQFKTTLDSILFRREGKFAIFCRKAPKIRSDSLLLHNTVALREIRLMKKSPGRKRKPVLTS